MINVFSLYKKVGRKLAILARLIDPLMLMIEKITTGPSNGQARLTPLEEREEPEEHNQHEFQFHQEDFTQHQH